MNVPIILYEIAMLRKSMLKSAINDQDRSICLFLLTAWKCEFSARVCVIVCKSIVKFITDLFY